MDSLKWFSSFKENPLPERKLMLRLSFKDGFTIEIEGYCEYLLTSDFIFKAENGDILREICDGYLVSNWAYCEFYRSRLHDV